jgi:anti-sigma regulatory factor (Ser/Thr protein kinase)
MAPPASVAGWADEALAVLTALPGARRVGLALVEGGGRRLQFTASDRDGSAQPWCEVDGYDDVPLNSAVRSGQPVIGAIADLAERYPGFVALQSGTPYLGLAAVPLVAADEVVGGFVTYFDQPQRFDLGQRRALTRLGTDLGAGLWRAQRAGVRRPARSTEDALTPAGAVVAVHEVVGGPRSVGEARAFLRGVLRDWRIAESVVDTATLCLSELVTNAVIHTHGGCVVHVVRNNGAVVVSVLDAGASGAAPRGSSADPLQVHGRGLQVVEALAVRWGHEAGDDGLSVWFEIATR